MNTAQILAGVALTALVDRLAALEQSVRDLTALVAHYHAAWERERRAQ